MSSKIILNDQNPHFKAVIIVKKAFVLFFIQFIAAAFFYSCKGYSYCDSEPFSLLYQYPGFYCGDSASGEGVRLYGFNITTATAKAVFVDLLQFQYIEEVVIDAVNNHYSANFMGNVTAAVYLDISCVNVNMPLVIDSAAFSHTAPVTKILGVGAGCDVSRLNWGFTSAFTNLQELNMAGNNFLTTFYTLPSVSLTTVTAFGLYSKDLEKGLVNFSTRYPEPLKQGLSRLSIRNNKDLSDFAINCFLIKWVTKYSKNSLISIDLSGNNLTKIPNEMRNYNNLESVNIWGYGNSIYYNGNSKPWTIQKDAFKLSAEKYKYLNLHDCNISAIEPGAFQGTYIFEILFYFVIKFIILCHL